MREYIRENWRPTVDAVARSGDRATTEKSNMKLTLSQLFLLVALVAAGCSGWIWGHSGAALPFLLTVPAIIVLTLLVFSRGRLSVQIAIGVAVNLALVIAKIGVFSYPIYYLPIIGLGSLPMAALFGSIAFFMKSDRYSVVAQAMLFLSTLLVVAELAFLMNMR